jgi:hypothetical protein
LGKNKYIHGKKKLKRKFPKFNKNSLILLFDREGQAGDNAEALYKYFMQNGYKNIFYVLSKDSQD